VTILSSPIKASARQASKRSIVRNFDTESRSIRRIDQYGESKKFAFVLAPTLTEEQLLATILSSPIKASARQASKRLIVRNLIRRTDQYGESKKFAFVLGAPLFEVLEHRVIINSPSPSTCFPLLRQAQDQNGRLYKATKT